MNWTNRFSNIFGMFANYTFPRPLQRIINRGYVWIFNIDLSEFDECGEYKNLNELFTRKLCVKRDIKDNTNSYISPCDSLIMAQGIINDNVALQIKGMPYSIYELIGEHIDTKHSADHLNIKEQSSLGDSAKTRESSKTIDSSNTTQSTTTIDSRAFYYINLYLSPKDYHRYHAPCDLKILYIRYIGGELLPVNKLSLLKNHNVFTRNERVIIKALDFREEVFYFIAVGALNVGKMVIHCEPRIQTNAKPNNTQTYTYNTPIELKKGEEIGTFMLGSTIVLLTTNTLFKKDIQQSVRFGEEILGFA